MKTIKLIGHLFSKIKYHIIDYLTTGIVLQLLRFLVLFPLVKFMFNFALSHAGIYAITGDTILTLITNPLSIAVLLLLLLIIGISIYVELGFYFLLADAQRKNEPYTLQSILKKLFKKIKYFFSIYSFVFVLYFVIIMPLAPIGLQGGITTRLYIPTFIVDELFLTTRGMIIYFAAIGVILYIALRLIYSVYFFVTEEKTNITGALKKSWKMSKRKSFYNYFLVFIISTLYILFMIILIAIVCIPMIVADSFFNNGIVFFASISTTLAQIVLIIAGGLLSPILFNLIVETAHTNEERRKYKGFKVSNVERKILQARWLKIAIVIALIGTTGVNYYNLHDGVFVSETLIVAHRGTKDEAVENSMTSLLDSIKIGADMMELDIQETSDQRFVVMHDYDLKRMAGINRKVYDMTLEELQQVEIYQNGYTDTISSLDEFFDVAKENKFKLLVEIKPHGNESDQMTENLIKLINEKGVKDLIVLQSLSLNAIDEVKKLDPSIKTCYVIPLVIGQLPITNHDYVALEDFSFSKRIIEEARANYKGIFAWTIDDKLSEYLEYNIEGVITNVPQEAIELKEVFADQPIIYRFLKRLSLN